MHTETPFRNTSYSRSAVPGIVALAIAILMSGTMFSAASAQDVATPVVEATPEGVANVCEATSLYGPDTWVTDVRRHRLQLSTNDGDRCARPAGDKSER